jgi:hypothetical protein
VKRLAELVVRVADLLEAEGRTLLEVGRTEAARLQTVLLRTAVGLTFLVLAVPLLGGAFVMIARGIYLGLVSVIGAGWASTVTGLIIFGFGGLCLWAFKLITTRPS